MGWERPRTIYLSYIVEACEDKSRAKSKFSYLKICICILVFVFVFVYLFICICICVTMCENKSKAKSKFSSPEICISWCQLSENIEISLIKYGNCSRSPPPNIHYWMKTNIPVKYNQIGVFRDGLMLSEPQEWKMFGCQKYKYSFL